MSEFEKCNKGLRDKVEDTWGEFDLPELVNFIRSEKHKIWNLQQKKIDQLQKENEELRDCIENNRPISFKGNLYVTTGCSYKPNSEQQNVYKLKE